MVYSLRGERRPHRRLLYLPCPRRASWCRKRTPDQIADAATEAEDEGHGNFAVAEALGNPDQWRLSNVTRAPGEGHTNVVNYLKNRQAGQGRRIANALSDGFEAPETAAERRLTQARDNAADAE
jgi:hypothetical protein